MVMERRPTWVQTRSKELSGGPFYAVSRAGREYGNENLPGARESSFCAVVRTGRGGGVDYVGG
eukprot:3743864-Alexandrium_andersonii.AAC.1